MISANERIKNFLFSIIFFSILTIVSVSILEVTVKLLLDNPSILKGTLLNNFRSHYLETDRKIIQYLAECGKYDNGLAYTLKPGNCRFKNREFDVEFLINKEGMRDDDASLISPEIVIIGDSHGMGWGVNQELTFSSRLENSLDRPVLNAAISSYGTVRELKLL